MKLEGLDTYYKVVSVAFTGLKVLMIIWLVAILINIYFFN